MMEAWGRGGGYQKVFVVKMSYCCGTEIWSFAVFCADHKTSLRVARGFLGWLPRLLYSWKTCVEIFSYSRNDGNSAIWTVWFLNHCSWRSYKSLNFAIVREYILSLYSEEGQIATWLSLLGMTFKLKLYYKFPLLHLSNNSKLRYSHKLTESLPLSLPSAPDGFYHLMKTDSFFSLSFIIYY